MVFVTRSTDGRFNGGGTYNLFVQFHRISEEGVEGFQRLGKVWQVLAPIGQPLNKDY